MVLEFADDVVNVPMSDVDPWADLAIGHYREGIRSGETPRNAWMLDTPAGVKKVGHDGLFRVMSRLSPPSAPSATNIAAESNNVAWTAGS